MTPQAQQALLDWFQTNQRDLPWRRLAQDPYAVWISEAMLQQTTVAAVVPYYERWIKRFPTPQSLAQARLEEVLAHWQGLGYYSRAKNLHRAAQTIRDQGLPQSPQEWRRLPGVGPYTAAAIASIAQNHPAPLVDGNVERVYARLNADPATNQNLKKNAWAWAAQVMSPHQSDPSKNPAHTNPAHTDPAQTNPARQSPGDFNQALMELGATICTPKNPRCQACPLQNHCQANHQSQTHLLPTPKPPKTYTPLHHQIWIPTHSPAMTPKTLYGLRKVPEGRWWAGLYEFPREEASPQGDQTLQSLLQNLSPPTKIATFAHVVTKHKITVDVHHAPLPRQNPDLLWATLDDLPRYPLPAPAKKALNELQKRAKQPPLWE